MVRSQRDRDSNDAAFSDSDDEDDDAQDLGYLEHVLRDGAPVRLWIREALPGPVENLAAGAGGVGQRTGLGIVSRTHP